MRSHTKCVCSENSQCTGVVGFGIFHALLVALYVAITFVLLQNINI